MLRPRLDKMLASYSTLKVVLFVLMLANDGASIFAQDTPVTAVVCLPNGNWLTGGDGGLAVHRDSDLTKIKTVASEFEKIYSIQISPDRTKLAVAGGTPGERGGIAIFDSVSLKQNQRFLPFRDVATDCCWLSNRQLAVCAMTGQCRVVAFDSKDAGMARRAISSKGILGLALAKPGLLITAGVDQTLRVSDAQTLLTKRVMNNHVGSVNQVSTRPINAKLESGGKSMVVSVSDDRTVRFWQPAIGRMVRFARVDDVPTCVTWDRDGKFAIVGTRSSGLWLVDPSTAKVIKKIETKGWVHCLAVSADNRHVVVGSEAGISKMSILEP